MGLPISHLRILRPRGIKTSYKVKQSMMIGEDSMRTAVITWISFSMWWKGDTGCRLRKYWPSYFWKGQIRSFSQPSYWKPLKELIKTHFTSFLKAPKRFLPGMELPDLELKGKQESRDSWPLTCGHLLNLLDNLKRPGEQKPKFETSLKWGVSNRKTLL